MTGGPACWSGDRGALEAALALYRASFEHTAIPDERVRALLAEGRYRLVLDGDAAEVRALALVAMFRQHRFHHLDYLATAAPLRRQGLGTQLVEWLVEQARAEGMAALTLEVEDRMLAFYGARGARRLAGLPYLFPSAAHGPLPMHVMAWPLDGRDELDRARAGELVRALYEGIHGRGDADPVLASILSRIPATVPLIGVPANMVAPTES